MLPMLKLLLNIDNAGNFDNIENDNNEDDVDNDASYDYSDASPKLT